MDDKKIEQLKALKTLFESGAISEAEYTKMKDDFLRESMAKDGVKSAQTPSPPSFIKKNKFLLIGILALIIGAIVFYFLSRPNADEEAKILAQTYCDCQSKTNEEHIKSLEQFITDFDNNKYEFNKDVDLAIKKMIGQYEKYTYTADITNCHNAFVLAEKDAKTKWPRSSGSGTTFWSSFDKEVMKNQQLNEQKDKIIQLMDQIENKKASLSFDNSGEFQSHQYGILNLLNSYYTNMSSFEFDAYNYFAYSVERYLTRKNVTPTEINLILKKPGDYTEKMTKVVDETLELVETNDDFEIWRYSTEFRAFRTSMNQYQICNIWYEVKVNRSMKITSYKEIKTENKRFLSVDDYNQMFNGYTPEAEYEQNSEY